MRHLLSLTLMFASILTGCDRRPAAVELQQATKNYATDVKDDYQRRARAQLKAMGDRIDALKAQAEHTQGAAQTQLLANVDTLTAQRDALAKRIDHMQDQGSAAFEAIKSGVDSALEDLQKSYDKAARELKR